MTLTGRVSDSLIRARRRGVEVGRLCCLALIVCVTACPRTLPDTTPIDRWLLCEECIEGELDSVVALDRRAAVRELEMRLKGPSPERIENMRRKFSASYRQIAAELGAGGPPLTESEYVRHFLANYIATYQSRAAVALGEIGTRSAIQALRDAAKDTTYRGDVLQAIHRALASAIVIETGDGQLGPVGIALPDTIAVRVVDARGGSVLGYPVQFSASADNGVVTGGSTITDSVAGLATVGSWTLGASPGPQFLDVTAGELSAKVNAMGTARPDTVLTLNSGQVQSTVVGTAVPIRPSVLVTYPSGSPLSGVVVRFADITTADPITVQDVTSDSSGIAAVDQWVLGSTQGQYRLRATAMGSRDTVIFIANATRPPPASIEIVRGDSQIGVIRSVLPVDPAVRVLDTNGDPASKVAVLFTVIEGRGRVSDAVQVTDSLGVAVVGSWALGRDTVRNRLRASTLELPGVVFRATASTGTCLTFSDQVPGTRFSVGDSILTDSILVFVERFQQDDSTWTSTGQAEVRTSGNAGGSGIEIVAGGTNLAFKFAYPGSTLYLSFGETGGNVNVRVNGDTANVRDLVDLDSTTVGGARIFVDAVRSGRPPPPVTPGSNWYGSFVAAGDLRDFAIGGEELSIDDVCFVPARVMP